MKILHTADWHLGKRLPPYSREEEQKLVLKEIDGIAIEEGADVIVIAGDVFDVSVPPASAEELFYEAVHEMSKHALVVAIAGNHDDGSRLKAPDTLAKVSGILLAGGFDCRNLSCKNVEGRKGGIIYRKDGERLNLALCPYLTESRRGDPLSEDFSEYVRGVLKEITDDVFSEDGCNVLAAHLFMMKTESGEERELGAAKLLPLSVLPECDYVALGHVHKPMALKENVRYSGCIMPYAFDGHMKKQVVIFDTQTKEIKEVPLVGGYPLITLKADGFASALEAVSGAGDAYVRLIYDCAVPLSAAETSALERAGKLVQLEIVPQGEKRETKRRAHRTPKELFEEYYGVCFGGEKPSEELTEEFLALMREELQ